MITPDFPTWTTGFARQLHRLRTSRGPTLHQFERLFRPWIPDGCLAQQADGDHSRDRCWNLRLVFWTFLWQVAQTPPVCDHDQRGGMGPVTRGAEPACGPLPN